MQATAQSGAGARRTFTDTARRAQIVRAATGTIAELGYRNASFAQIAKRAGLSSTGLISYHFDSRNELIGQVVADILAAIGAHMSQRMAHVSSATEALRTYIEANAEFTGSHREEMTALLEIFLGGGFRYDATSEHAALAPIEGILREGQRSGEFRGFDPKVMATLIQRSVDGLPFLLAAEPDVDPRRYGAEAATAFYLATRAEPI
ncbi:MAG: TetR family transcriptional regulator [Streptosporangiaceae bacterium]